MKNIFFFNKIFYLPVILSTIIAVAYYFPSKKTTSAITYQLNGGRLGDNIYSYVKALWISYSYNIPLLYIPFPRSEYLCLDNYHVKLTQEIKKEYEKIAPIKNAADLELEDTGLSKTLFVSSIYYQEPSWTKDSITSLRKDETFLKLLKKYISPKEQLSLVSLPPDKITIAIHVRRGGGFDIPLLMQQKDRLGKNYKDFADGKWPLKFPPDSYYTEQLQKIIELFPHRELYVYIFTDDNNPELIAQEFAAYIHATSVEFDYRKTNNSHDRNILEDLFSMANFDCLIRTQSAFSQIAHLIGNHNIVYWPEDYIWDKHNTLSITKVGNESAL